MMTLHNVDYDYVKALTQMFFTGDEITINRDERQYLAVITLPRFL